MRKFTGSFLNAIAPIRTTTTHAVHPAMLAADSVGDICRLAPIIIKPYES
jgi:hypothetical protein